MAMRTCTLTCADKHHVVFLTIGCLHLVNDDACEFDTPPHQQRLVSNGQNSLVHQGPELDKTKGGVWEVKGLIYTCFTSLVVDTLVEGTGQSR